LDMQTSHWLAGWIRPVSGSGRSGGFQLIVIATRRYRCIH
jgi:hypothetical protein